MARKTILTPLLLPLLLAGLLFQAAVPAIRIAITYGALDAQMSATVIALLSSAFALLPIGLAMPLGRYIDGGGAGRSVVAGALLMAASALTLLLVPMVHVALFAGAMLMGVSQAACMATLQFIVSRVSGKVHRDAVLGHYLLAVGLGQMLGPMLVAFSGSDDPGEIARFLLNASLVGIAALLACTLFLGRRLGPSAQKQATAPKPRLRAFLGQRALLWIIVAGGIVATAQDLMMVFLPVLGEERGLPVAVVGVLLTLRAGASMLSRIAFGPLMKRFGRVRTLRLSMLVAAVSQCGPLLPVPVEVLAIIIAAGGFALGVALSCTISLTIHYAPPNGRGTALSLRVAANRISQTVLPFMAGLVAVPLGTAGIFMLGSVTLFVVSFGKP